MKRPLDNEDSSSTAQQPANKTQRMGNSNIICPKSEDKETMDNQVEPMEAVATGEGMCKTLHFCFIFVTSIHDCN